MNLQRKKRITTDQNKLKDAVKLKEKVNKMIIANGVLYFFSHIPQFIFTLVFFVLKKRVSTFCFFYFQCNDFLEILRTFNFVFISFHFFIFKKFDKNIRDSYEDIVARYLQLRK